MNGPNEETQPAPTPAGETPAGDGASSVEEAWVWSAMAPAERRARLAQLRTWVEWLVAEYPSELAGTIPTCWYRHRSQVNRITALYVAWLRTYVEAGDNQRDTALVEWHDALDRTISRLNWPSKCLDTGEHVEPADAAEVWVWATDPAFSTWLGTAPAATAAAYHPAPVYLPVAGDPSDAEVSMSSSPPPSTPHRPPAGAAPFDDVMPAELMAEAIARGDAERLASSAAVSYRGSWWLGSDTMYVRVTDAAAAADLTHRAERYARATQAVAAALGPGQPPPAGDGS